MSIGFWDFLQIGRPLGSVQTAAADGSDDATLYGTERRHVYVTSETQPRDTQADRA